VFQRRAGTSPAPTTRFDPYGFFGFGVAGAAALGAPLGGIDPSGRYEFSAHSGDIRLGIPGNTSAQLSVSTWSGALDSPDFPITLRPGEHSVGSGQAKRFTFDIGGGAARISAETFSGDITISSRGSSRR